MNIEEIIKRLEYIISENKSYMDKTKTTETLISELITELKAN